MGGEDEAWLAGAVCGEAAKDIGAAGGDFAEFGIGAAVAEEGGYEFGAGLFARVIDAGGAVGVDARDSDEGLEKTGYRGGGHG
jgi:hypothetical protein